MSRAMEAVFTRADAIADAVLWEGYVLYPYRRSAAKNRIRFQWGVVGPAEEPTMTSTVLVELDTATVHLRLRFLHLRRRADGWDEAVAVDHDLVVTPVPGESAHAVTVAAGGGGEAIEATLRVRCVPDGGVMRLMVTVSNPGPGRSMPREDALLHSMVGTHVLFAAATDAFVSLLEPPPWAESAAARCEQHRCWPVLVGPAPRRDLVLASPVILYDFPAVSAESIGDFFDGTEIDEMLTLRVQTMTDDEKAEARATDPRAAAIIDRCDGIADDVMASLHGVTRGTDGRSSDGSSGGPRGAEPTVGDPNPEWSDPGPGTILVAGVPVAKGSHVVLHPRRRADAHDIFLRDRAATVAEIVHDVDGDVHIAVTIDDDPGADLWDLQRRYLYFAPDEIEVVGHG